ATKRNPRGRDPFLFAATVSRRTYRPRPSFSSWRNRNDERRASRLRRREQPANRDHLRRCRFSLLSPRLWLELSRSFPRGFLGRSLLLFGQFPCFLRFLRESRGISLRVLFMQRD